MRYATTPGLTVTPVDPQFFEAIYQFRSAVEPLAVRLATPRLTKQAIAQGRSLIMSMTVWHEHRRILEHIGTKRPGYPGIRRSRQ